MRIDEKDAVALVVRVVVDERRLRWQRRWRLGDELLRLRVRGQWLLVVPAVSLDRVASQRLLIIVCMLAAQVSLGDVYEQTASINRLALLLLRLLLLKRSSETDTGRCDSR